MPTTVADRLVDCLLDWGVEIVFGLPGDGINGLIEALRTRQDRIRFLHVRHEESAALMACAYAKVTGKLGVCMATSGPGGLHLLNGLYDAKLDGQPVLAITGLPYHDLLGTFTQQDVELDKVFENVAVYNTRVRGTRNQPGNADEAPGRCPGVGKATASGCDRRSGQRDVHGLVGATHFGPTRPAVYRLRHAGDYGLRASLRPGGAGDVPGETVRRVYG